MAIHRFLGLPLTLKEEYLCLKEEEFSGQRWKDFRVKGMGLSANGSKEEYL